MNAEIEYQLIQTGILDELYLFVFRVTENGELEPIYGDGDFSFRNPEDLLELFQLLKGGDDLLGYGGSENPADFYRAVLKNNPIKDVVADQEGIYRHRMGPAAKRIFSVPVMQIPARW